MNRVEVKPLSVNAAWKGRRFKTDDYKNYEKEVLLKLKPMKVPEGDLSVDILLGMSSVLSDIDNPVKIIIDILQKKYNFNDRRVMCLFVEKVKVEKGREFFSFNILSYTKIEEVMV